MWLIHPACLRSSKPHIHRSRNRNGTRNQGWQRLAELYRMVNCLIASSLVAAVVASDWRSFVSTRAAWSCLHESFSNGAWDLREQSELVGSLPNGRLDFSKTDWVTKGTTTTVAWANVVNLRTSHVALRRSCDVVCADNHTIRTVEVGVRAVQTYLKCHLFCDMKAWIFSKLQMCLSTAACFSLSSFALLVGNPYPCLNVSGCHGLTISSINTTIMEAGSSTF